MNRDFKPELIRFDLRPSVDKTGLVVPILRHLTRKLAAGHPGPFASGAPGMLILPHSNKNEGEGEAMKMRMIGDTWYSNFSYKGDKIQIMLEWEGKKVTGGTKTNPPNNAYKALGSMMNDLENGIAPGGIRKKIGKVKFPKEVWERLGDRTQGIIKNYIHPFFGDYKRRDLDETLIKKYMAHRWGFADGGGLQAMHNTWKKERNALQRLVRLIDPAFSVPTIKYKKLSRVMLQPLGVKDINKAARYVKYSPVFWAMAYTALDISDAIAIAPEHIRTGRIIMQRSKTGQEIRIPVCTPLLKIFNAQPRPISDTTPYFAPLLAGLKTPAKTVSKDVRNGFKQAGYGVTKKEKDKDGNMVDVFYGYGSKYLRRYLASFFLDQGYPLDWIQLMLAHAEGSSETIKYTKVYDATADEAFSKLA